MSLYIYLKMVADVVFSLILLVALSPLLAIVAILIRLESHGPSFFRQERPGLHGRVFVILKFRTMRLETHDTEGRRLGDVERLTRVGRILRSTSIDELPQLINVVKGEMCFIGPRPLLVQYIPLYTKHQMRRHEVRPGITGWAQIQGRNALSWEEKFDLDVWYVDNMSFGVDLKILWGTFLKLLTRDGVNQSEGITMDEFAGSK